MSKQQMFFDKSSGQMQVDWRYIYICLTLILGALPSNLACVALFFPHFNVG